MCVCVCGEVGARACHHQPKGRWVDPRLLRSVFEQDTELSCPLMCCAGNGTDVCVEVKCECVVSGQLD